jgi:hypothetical protein
MTEKTPPSEPSAERERPEPHDGRGPDSTAEPLPDEEVVTLEDVQEIESTIAALDAIAQAPLPEEEPPPAALDRAFDAIAPSAAAREAPAPEVVEPPTPAPAAGSPEVRVEEPAPAAAETAEEPAPAAAVAPDERDAEIARLQDRISELRIAAGRFGEVRARLEDELAGATRELADARRRVAELEALLAKHEQRVVKAYQRLKGDEQLRERTRKALAIALQLLDESGARAATAERPRDG